MTDTKKIAEKIWKAVKATLADAKKRNNKDKANPWRVSQMAEIFWYDDTTWIEGKGWVTNGYIIRVEGKEIAKVSSKYDLNKISDELSTLIRENKKVKGWGGLVAISDMVSFGLYDNFNLVIKVSLADAVCKEYKSLMNYINKFGVGVYGGKVNLGEYRLFSAAMGGKRGRLWDEYGERRFLDNKPKRCAEVLNALRKMRGTKDIMTCKYGEENYIDDFERKHSEYYEVECEGEKRHYLEIVIKTPNGKVKMQEKIY